MKKLLLKSLLLLCALIVGGASSVWADGTAGFTLTSMPGTQTQSSGTITGTQNESWSWTYVPNEGKTVYNNTASSTWQMGSQSNPATSLTLSTSGITGTITQIVVSCASYQGKGSISATVGGNNFGTQNQTLPTWANSSTSNITFTGSATGAVVITMTNGTSGQRAMYLKSVTVTYTGGTSTVATPTISGQTPFYPSTQVTIACSTDGAAIQYSLDNGTNWNDYSTPFALTETKTVKAKATKSGSTDSDVASKDFTKGTVQNVTEALTAINALADNGTIDDQFVEGIVSTAGTSVSSGQITYYISVDGSNTNQLQVYKGKGLNNANFSAVTDIALGDKVTVFGQLKKYVSGTNTTLEINSGNYLVDFVAVPRFSIAAGVVASGTDVELTTPQAGYTIYYTTDGTDPKTSGTEYTAAITITATTTIKAYAKKGTISSNVATAEYTVAAPAATPTFSVAAGAYGTAQNVVLSTTTDGAEIYYTTNGTEPTTSSTKYTSAIVVNKNTTIKAIAVKEGMANSAVAEATYTFYAAIPFAFDGSGTEAGSIMGLTANGIGNYDYSPKMKFGATDDYLILQINEAAEKLYYDIKGNSFSGTFKVQTSVDGETYTDLKSYTSLTSTVLHESLDLATTVRFIKWIFTNKAGGNVGLGRIGIDCEAAYFPSAGYATYNTPSAIDFTGTGVQAFKVSSIGTDEINLVEITKAPAGTPLVLKASAGNYALNIIASADEITGNQLFVSTGNVTTDDSYDIYALASKGSPAVVGFYHVKAGTKVPAGKCYIRVAKSSSARELFGFAFDDEATGVNEMKAQKVDGQFYDLQGRKVANPAKGLYIVNGKKVIIK